MAIVDKNTDYHFKFTVGNDTNMIWTSCRKNGIPYVKSGFKKVKADTHAFVWVNRNVKYSVYKTYEYPKEDTDFIYMYGFGKTRRMTYEVSVKKNGITTTKTVVVGKWHKVPKREQK